VSETSPISQTEGAVSGEDPEAIFELAAEQAGAEELGTPSEPAPEEPCESPATSISGPVAGRSAEPTEGKELSVQKAIEEVAEIVDSLRGALDEMEEVLEMLEMFERQQNADEREIETLRRALRQMQRPRDGGHQRR
jgi:predicted house-cleaning noncanonical NTP pyrophosphatase (MazG superfamily)